MFCPVEFLPVESKFCSSPKKSDAEQAIDNVVPRRNSLPTDAARNEFGVEIRRLRRVAGLTQGELAARLQTAGWDVGLDALSQIETCKRTLTDTELVRILRALRISWDDVRLPKI